MNAARPIVVFDAAPPETAVEIVRQNPMLGPAAKLCYQVLYEATNGGKAELHCWPHELATRCGHRDRRCASDWIDTLIGSRFVEAVREPRQPWRIRVLQPEFGPRRKPLVADPQGELTFGNAGECDADSADSDGSPERSSAGNEPKILRLATPVAVNSPADNPGVCAQKPPDMGDPCSEHPPPAGVCAGDFAQKPPDPMNSQEIDRACARAARPSEPSEPLEGENSISFIPSEPLQPLEPSSQRLALQVEALAATILDRVNHWHVKTPERFRRLYKTPALKVARFVLAGEGPARRQSLLALLDSLDDLASRDEIEQPYYYFCGSHLARRAGVSDKQ